MQKVARCVAIAGWFMLALARGLLGGEPMLADVPAALASLTGKPTVVSFESPGNLSGGGHLQGVQLRTDANQKRQVLFLSHDGLAEAYLVSIEFPLDFSSPGGTPHVHVIASDGRRPPLRHAGGMQICGDVLAVGVEDNQLKTRSEVRFFNVANSRELKPLVHLTIPRTGSAKSHTAGAVGLVRRADDHLLAVANWDSRDIDFYRTNGRPLADSDCRFSPWGRWSIAHADKIAWQGDKIFAAYQAINLVIDAQQRVYLFGFDDAAAGKGVIDLFAVDLTTSAKPVLTKQARKATDLVEGARFRGAGGLWIEEGRLTILAAPHDWQRENRLNLVR